MTTPKSFIPACLLFISSTASARETERPTLDFVTRVTAQEAIERVYYAHREGTSLPFEAAVPRETIEAKVVDALRLSVALDEQGTPITARVLEDELRRILRDSQDPGRLRELFAALHDDPLLIQECLVRPVLARRLLEGQRSDFGTWWPAVRQRVDPSRAEVVADPAVSLDALSMPSPQNACTIPDTWSYGSLGTALDQGSLPKLIWTGSEVLKLNGSWTAGLARGERYDPATDVWTPMSMVNAPSSRYGAGVVWTGTELIIDGGGVSSVGWANYGYVARTDAAAYNPATDTWTRFAGSGRRYGGCSVWTGSEVISWGGRIGYPYATWTGNGQRLNPVTKVWTPISTANQPWPRSDFACVWTGTEMIVAGGDTNNEAGIGKRYNPATNTWTTMATGPLGYPGDRGFWTGSQMIFWTGDQSANRAPSIYDLGHDEWRAATAVGGPAQHHRGESIVWDGSRLVVWGGDPFGSYSTTIYRYDPVGDAWTSSSPPGAPQARRDHGAVWTGDEMIVWGGVGSTFNATRSITNGGRYRPATNSWSSMASPGPVLSTRSGGTAVWSGSEMLVWGGRDWNLVIGEGFRYDPALDAFASMGTAGQPAPREAHTAVWTGTRMLVWGGLDVLGVAYGDGAAYDPVSDAWSSISASGAPAPRSGHTAIWTGTRMLVWGGGYPASPGARYDPASNSWAPIGTSGEPSGRLGHTAVWAGGKMLIWGGHSTSDATCPADGGAYDPATNLWVPIQGAGGPTGRMGHAAVGTGSKMIVWGGRPCTEGSPTLPVADGAIYDPATGLWTTMSTTGRPARRWMHSMIWTGNRAIVWGGKDDGAEFLDSKDWEYRAGATFDPVANQWSSISLTGAPAPTYGHFAFFTGADMLVWGGNNDRSGARYGITGGPDVDADGTPACAGDCNDGNGAIWSTPGEAGALLFAANKTSLSWAMPSQPGGLVSALRYDTLRSSLSSDFTAALCLDPHGTDQVSTDGTNPAPGAAAFYLVRAENACPAGQGSLGTHSDGTPRAGAVCP